MLYYAVFSLSGFAGREKRRSNIIAVLRLLYRKAPRFGKKARVFFYRRRANYQRTEKEWMIMKIPAFVGGMCVGMVAGAMMDMAAHPGPKVREDRCGQGHAAAG